MRAVKTMLAQLWCRYVGYYNGQHYHFSYSSEKGFSLYKAELGANTKRCIIVSDCSVNYRVESLPIRQTKELHKLLALKASEKERYLVYSVSDAGSKVGIWQCQEALEQGAVFFPETLLVSLTLPPKTLLELEVGDSQPQSYVANHHGEMKATFKGGVITSPEGFSAAHGIAIDACTQLTFNDKAQVMFEACKNVKLRHLIAFRPRLTKFNLSVFCWSSVTSVIAVLTLYMAITSTFLSVSTKQLGDKVASQNEQLGGLFEMQEQIDKASELTQELNRFISEQPNIIYVWPAIAELFNDLDIDNFQVSGERIVIRAQAKSATQTLESLNASPFIKGARFDSNIANTRRGERFTISFLVDVAPIDASSESAND